MIVSVLLALLLGLGLYIASHKLAGVQAIVALGLLASGIVLVVFPNVASVVASKLNVGRGTDLLLYFAVTFGLFLAAHYYFRFKRQEAVLTQIVRTLAIREALPEVAGSSQRSTYRF